MCEEIKEPQSAPSTYAHKFLISDGLRIIFEEKGIGAESQGQKKSTEKTSS